MIYIEREINPDFLNFSLNNSLQDSRPKRELLLNLHCQILFYFLSQQFHQLAGSFSGHAIADE